MGKSGLAAGSWVLKAIFENISVFFFPVYPLVNCVLNKYLCIHFCSFFHMHKTWLMSFSVTSFFTEISSFLPQSSILDPVLLCGTCLGKLKKSGSGEAETSKGTASTGKWETRLHSPCSCSSRQTDLSFSLHCFLL